MLKNKTKNREKIVVATILFMILFLGLIARLVYFMVFQSQKIEDLPQFTVKRQKIYM